MEAVLNPDRLAALASAPRELMIGGDWRPAGRAATFDVFDPASGDVIVSVADAEPSDGIRALAAAAAAADAWERTPPRTRGELLRATFELVNSRAEQFASLITLEMGKPLVEARAEVAYGNEYLRWFSEEAVRVTGRYGPTPEGTGRMIVTHAPVGPCYLITPWNFPLAMATRKIAPALAAGCTVVVKPSELTPLTTLLLAATLEEAGIPAGVVNVITTIRAKDVSEAIMADPRLRKVSFTGSTMVGKELIRQAAGGVLRTSMELGGNAPFIVFDDADLPAALDGAMQAKFRNMGQACTAANRFLVHEAVAEEFGRMLTNRVRQLAVGSGFETGTDIGPLIDQRAVGKMAAFVADAVRHGALLVAGGIEGSGPGYFYQPTVLLGVQPGSSVLDQEIFGPVLAVSTFTDEIDAIRKANATPYGLAAYVYTQDLARAQRMIEALQAGIVGVNSGLVSNAAAPFGGVKESGTGREGGIEGIVEYLSMKYVMTPDPFSKPTPR